jgi:hypothetical protein
MWDVVGDLGLALIVMTAVYVLVIPSLTRLLKV